MCCDVGHATGEGLASGVMRAVALPTKAARLAIWPKDIEAHLGRDVMPSRRDIGVVKRSLLVVGVAKGLAREKARTCTHQC